MLILAYIISITLMIVLPVALAAGLRRVATTAWLLFCIGSLTFIVSQVVHLPLNEWLADLGWLPGKAASDLPIWRTALIAGLTAGVCEELARRWRLRLAPALQAGLDAPARCRHARPGSRRDRSHGLWRYPDCGDVERLAALAQHRPVHTQPDRRTARCFEPPTGSSR